MPTGLEAYSGHAAALATSMFWMATSLFFTAAGKRLGPTHVNGVRLILAVILLGVTHRMLTGYWIPETLGKQVAFLAVSGIVGLTIGDQALLVSFIDVGPRITLLIMTTSPLFAAFFGWMVLEETLPPMAWIGIAMTVSGVAWVILERSETPAEAWSHHRRRGILLAFVGAACQAGGLLLSKQGMGHGWLASDQHLDPQAATLLRMVFAALGFAPILIWHALRENKAAAAGTPTKRVGSPRAGLAFTFCGAVVGPFLGVWCSLIAADRTPLGVAQSLSSLAPIFIIPVVAILYKERITSRAVLGAAVAVGGSSLLVFQS
ncbi:MAG: DMT family transporter [Phycisphaerae bacterium]